jgi:hypothetical protein
MAKPVLTVVVPGAADILEVAADAQRVADYLGINVAFEFNGVLCQAQPGGTAARLASSYHMARNAKGRAWS